MNLLLISIDSLRLDCVPRFNRLLDIGADAPLPRRPETPRFARATAGYGFHSGCFSVSTATRPVHTSLFSGLYPFEHGVTGMQVPKERPGLEPLFGLMDAAGYRLTAHSETPAVFSGLDWARPVGPWSRTLDRDLHGLVSRGPDRQCLFLHYWATHAPYGAADGLATGTTLNLLRQGRVAEVQAAYLAAVEGLLERRLAPLLESLDPARWTVFIFGDHGETWDGREYYHGQTLRNATLRVPLYFHVPPGHNPDVPRPVVSLMDLYPTLIRLFDLPASYRGYAADLWAHGARHPPLAELEPTPHLDDLAPGADNRLLASSGTLGPQWALLKPTQRYTRFCARDEGVLQETFSEDTLPVDAATHAAHVGSYEEMVNGSAYGKAGARAVDAEETEALEQRLRDLGYLA